MLQAQCNVGHAVNRQSAAQLGVLLQHYSSLCPVRVLYTNMCVGLLGSNHVAAVHRVVSAVLYGTVTCSVDVTRTGVSPGNVK